MSDPAPRAVPRPLLYGAVGLLLVAGAIAVYTRARRGSARDARPPSDYVGIAVCRSCHADEHASYERTPHSRAFRPVRPAEEPLPARVDHANSRTAYEMYVDGETMRIRELLTLPNGQEVLLSNHAVQYVVGSGEFSLTYASHVDGAFLESPTTWYAEPKAWGMSPGYTGAVHLGMSRTMAHGCLRCHIGQLERVGEGEEQLGVHEHAIGCERCHGDGRAHVVRQRARSGREPEGGDPSIVNPLQLTRDQTLDLCAQCHLDDTLTVPLADRNPDDWRPGMPLARFQVTYRLKASQARMTVVGHMDQMKLSRCFQASDSMTCLSCHDPHGRPAPEARAAHYREACLRCHAPTDCDVEHGHRGGAEQGHRGGAEQGHRGGAEQGDRGGASAPDDCVRCHMPRGATDLPHFAFTHHRIGIHVPGRTPAPRPDIDPLELVPASDISGLSPGAQERALGLAYVRLAARAPEDPEKRALSDREVSVCLDRAHRHLRAALEQGERDADVLLELANLEQRRDPEQGFRRAQEGLAAEGRLRPDTRVRLLAIIAGTHFQRGRHAEARQTLETLTTLRRDGRDWTMLATVLRSLGDREGARRATERALAINPTSPGVQMGAFAIYAWLGDTERARAHDELRRVLEERWRAYLRAGR